MKTEYYLVYHTSKGDKDSASEAVLLGELSPERIDDLESAIKVNNAKDEVGEFVVVKEQGHCPGEKENLDDLTFAHLWNRCRGSCNPILSHLKNRYQQCNVDPDEATVWEIMTGKPYSPEHFVSRTIEDIQLVDRVIRSIPKCSESNNCDDAAMMDYVLRLVSLFENWMSRSHRGFTERKMLLYFRQCLAYAGDDSPVERAVDLLKTLDPHAKKWLQPQPQQDSCQEEPYYELTDLGRARAIGSIKSLLSETQSVVETHQESEWTDGSADVNDNDISPAVRNAMFQSHYEAGLALKYTDQVDEWHFISLKKFKGVGWANIARAELEQKKNDKVIKSYNQGNVDALARNIENRVKAHRKKLGIND